MTNPTEHSAEQRGTHRRRNPLTGEWVLVAAGRDQRPWRGQTESAANKPLPRHDPTCYLCPGNERANGSRNPDYAETFVFPNDFAALKPRGMDDPKRSTDPLYAEEPVQGTCRVICFSERHDLGLSQMSNQQLRRVVDLWCSQHEDLAREWEWVQIFENRGTAMGASNPHPHGQVWASSTLPTIVRAEVDHQREYQERHGAALLSDYAAQEVAAGERLVLKDRDWAVVVPFWATWPFETILISRAGRAGFADLSTRERSSLAVILGELLAGYDAVFDAPFPYSMGWHPSPASSRSQHWVLHAHIYPPLLRAEARKFLVGYEMLAEAQRDLTAEDAAARLRDATARSSRAPR